MTLEEYRATKKENLFLAIIKKNLNWEEAGDKTIFLEEFPEGISISDLLKFAAEGAIMESGEELTEERRQEVENEVKQTIMPCLEELTPVILLKVDEEEYIDLSTMEKFDSKEYEVKVKIPISQYFEDEDFSFEEDDEGIYFSVDTEKFDSFTKDYEEW